MIAVLTALCVAIAAFFVLQIGAAQLVDAARNYRHKHQIHSAAELADFWVELQPAQLRVLSVCSALVGAFLGSLLSPLLAFAVAVTGALAPSASVRWARERRRERIEKLLADALAGIAGAVRSGLTLRQAIAEVAANTPDPLGQELRIVSRELQLGTTIDEALQNLAVRTRSKEIELFVSAAQIALKIGGNIAETFDKLASTLRERFRIEGRVKALTAQGKLQGIIIGIMPLVVWIGFDYFRPDLTRPMFESWFGYAMVLVIVVMEALGAVMIRHITRIEI